MCRLIRSSFKNNRKNPRKFLIFEDFFETKHPFRLLYFINHKQKGVLTMKKMILCLTFLTLFLTACSKIPSTETTISETTKIAAESPYLFTNVNEIPYIIHTETARARPLCPDPLAYIPMKPVRFIKSIRISISSESVFII